MMNRVLLTLGLALTLTACADKDSADDTGGGDGGGSENGSELFAAKCAGCHGSDGGGTASGADLTARVPELSDADLQDVIENGTAANGGGMPDLGLTASEVSAVFDYVRDAFGEEGGG